jgi:acetyl esterase/lipase
VPGAPAPGRADTGDPPAVPDGAVSTGDSVDPELVGAAARFAARDLSDLEAARTPRAAHSLETPEDVTVRDVRVPRSDDEHPLLLRVFRPRGAGTGLPALVQLHAGGFVLGSIAQDHQRNVALCRALSAVVVSVDYRLAPEHPYPAAVKDCCTALDWVHRTAGETGVDASRVALHGRSAGGGLAAATALLARDRGGPAVRFLYLGMPQLDDRMTSASMWEFDRTPMWTRASAERSWELYLGAGVPGSEGVDAYAAPARERDLRGLPPTYVSAMQLDPLRDEAIAFGSALLAAGVATELHVFPGTFHGSGGLVPEAGVSRRELAEEIAVLGRAFARLR